METRETQLSTIPGATERERLIVVLCQTQCGASRIELRQQSWGDGVGWFTQSRVELAPHQVADLKNSLGVSTTQKASVPAAYSRISTPSSWSPKVVHADSA